MLDQSLPSNRPATPIGLMALIQELELPVRLPTVRSWSRASARKSSVTRGSINEYYPPRYARHGVIENLKFALRYEPIDLSVYHALFKVLESELLEGWIRQEPTSAYARRAWFLYEALTGNILDVPDVPHRITNDVVACPPQLPQHFLQHPRRELRQALGLGSGRNRHRMPSITLGSPIIL